MCIFSQPVNSVGNTRIFARSTSVDSQFLVYQMNYDSQDPNAMILPIPVKLPAREDSLRFINLEKYPEFFAHLMNGFPYHPPSFSIGCSSYHDGVVASALEVFEVGNYIASFVPQMSDFARLDARFTLPEETWAKIPEYQNYGFAVFQLAAGSLQPHPMAFEFETSNQSIYFPTRHIHDGEVHDAEDFDHLLYLQHAGFDSQVNSYQNSDITDQQTGLVRSKTIANRFCDLRRSSGIVDGNLLVHKKEIRGTRQNEDTFITTTGHPTKPISGTQLMLESNKMGLTYATDHQGKF